ncbi:MAG TPA: hypothetical protein VE056_12885 [Pyrinomonadaceae bacterium]|nr:hypothetical protein [Pyrinomonadaceae bacterium]
MLKILVICIAILIAVANGSAQTSGNKRYVSHKPGVVRVGPTTTYLKEGLSTEQVIRLLGQPSAITERAEKDLIVTMYEFPRGEGRVLIAEFVSDALIASRIETRVQIAQSAR